MYRKRVKWPPPFESPQRKIEDNVLLRGISTTFIGHATVLLQVKIMDGREQRGLEIAATVKMRQKGSTWIVPKGSSENTTSPRFRSARG